MEKISFELPLIRAFDGLTSRRGEVWIQEATMVEYAPFPGLHHDLERYQQYLLSELNFFAQTRVSARDILFHGLVTMDEQNFERLENFKVIKVKCGRSALGEEIAFFNFLTDRFPQAQFRIDANRRWSYQDLQQFAGKIDLQRVDYFEEPCADSLPLARDYPIALDESVQQYMDRPKSLENIRALVVKPHLYQSIEQVLALLRGDIPVVLSSLFNSSVGTQNLLRLACLGSLDITHGPDPFFYLGQDTVKNPLLARGDCFPREQVEKQLELS